MEKKVNFQFSELRLSVHSLERMFEREISENDIEALIDRGEIIESYPDALPDPSFLVFGMVGNRPLHLVVGLNDNEKRLTVITLYEPNLSKFEEDFKTRRK